MYTIPNLKMRDVYDMTSDMIRVLYKNGFSVNEIYAVLRHEHARSISRSRVEEACMREEETKATYPRF